MLNIIKLPHEITRRTTCDSRYIIVTFQVAAMAGCATKGFADAACEASHLSGCCPGARRR